MVKTGYISFITEVAGGQDGDGNVIPSTSTASVFIPCNLDTLSKEFKVLIHGEYQNATYSVIVDSDKVYSLDPAIDLKEVTEIHLQDNNGNDLKAHRIANLEYLNLTKRIKIVV